MAALRDSGNQVGMTFKNPGNYFLMHAGRQAPEKLFFYEGQMSLEKEGPSLLFFTHDSLFFFEELELPKFGVHPTLSHSL